MLGAVIPIHMELEKQVTKPLKVISKRGALSCSCTYFLIVSSYSARFIYTTPAEAAPPRLYENSAPPTYNTRNWHVSNQREVVHRTAQQTDDKRNTPKVLCTGQSQRPTLGHVQVTCTQWATLVSACSPRTKPAMTPSKRKLCTMHKALKSTYFKNIEISVPLWFSFAEIETNSLIVCNLQFSAHRAF